MTDSIFDDFEGFLQPFLARPGTSQARGRLTASEIGKLAPSPRESKLNQSAENAIVPIAYGETPVSGKLIGFVENGSHKYYLVMWSIGPVHSIKTLFINDSADLSGVTDLEIRHYLGTAYQPIDPWFESFVAGYEDDLVYTKPAGKTGVVCSAIKIATSWVDTNGNPAFQAIEKGRFCYDPDKSTYTDSYYDDVSLQVEFIGADSSTPTDLDASLHSHTLTYVASADIQSNKLSLNGTDEAVTVAHDAVFAPGTDPWCIEITAATSSIAAGTKTLFNRGVVASSRLSIDIGRSGAALTVSLSSDGSTADLLSSSISSAFVADTDLDIILVFTGQGYMLIVDGVIEDQSITSTPVFANSDPIEIGQGSGFWGGTVTRVRYTVGAYRVASSIDPAEVQTPWFDSGRYKTGYVYTDNSGLCTAELIANDFYGKGVAIADIQGIKAAKDWSDSLLGGAVPRGRLSLLITDPRQTEAYIDLLCSYAGLFNVPDEAGYALIPDRPPTKETPSGQQKVPLHTMQRDPSAFWTLGDGWAYGTNALELDGTQAAETTASVVLSDLVVGELYAVKIAITWGSGGAGDAYTISIDGTAQESGTSGANGVEAEIIFQFAATAVSHTLEITGDADLTLALTLCSVRSFKWIETDIVQGSLRFKGIENTNTPSRVRVAWREPSSTSANWPEKPAVYTLPDAETGAIPLIETSLPMPGIFRAEEANNKAEARALRLRSRNQYQWESLDSGIALRVGTWVKLMLPELTQDLMLLSARMNRYGRYGVSGETASETHYPDTLTLPENTGTVPVGAVMMPTTSTPDGYSVWSAADGKYLIIYDPDNVSYEIGDTPGAATYAGWTGVTSVGGDHTSSEGGENIPIEDLRDPEGSAGSQTVSDNVTRYGAHSHGYTTGVITPDLYRRANVLIEKTGTDGLVIPQGCMVFGLPGITVQGLSRSTVWANRVIQAAASNALAGLVQQLITFATNNATMPDHDHFEVSAFKTTSDFPEGFAYEQDDVIRVDHAHNHNVSIELIRNMRRVGLALYIASSDASVVPGIMLLWKGAVSGLLAYPDWTVCDGRLGTINPRRCLIEIAAEGQENVIQGDNTISLNGPVQFDEGHTHLDPDAELGIVEGITYVGHDLWAHKDHTITNSASFQPPSQVVALIMFNPIPDWGWVDLALLLGGGGADGVTDIEDSSPRDLTADVSTSIEYDDTYNFFGGGTSLRLASSRLDYDAIFANGINGRFTLAGWFRPFSLAADQWICSTQKGATTEDYWELRIDTNGDLEFLYEGSVEIQGSGEAGANVDMFIAVTWDGVEFQLYSGTIASDTISRIGTFEPTSPNLNDNLTLFNNNAATGAMTGWAEDIYLVDGAVQFREAVESVPDQPPRS
tara:strand:+ start:34375 stop:38496 length:4122 start_codon:yes stop_codon:yes gene_type:complete